MKLNGKSDTLINFNKYYTSKNVYVTLLFKILYAKLMIS